MYIYLSQGEAERTNSFTNVLSTRYCRYLRCRKSPSLVARVTNRRYCNNSAHKKYGMVWYGVVWCGVVWCGVVMAWRSRGWRGCPPSGTVTTVPTKNMEWCGMVWYGHGMAWPSRGWRGCPPSHPPSRRLVGSSSSPPIKSGGACMAQDGGSLASTI